MKQEGAAFTLVETLAAVAIVALLTVLGASLLGSGAADLGKTGGTLADLSALARETALSRNTPAALVVVTRQAATAAAPPAQAATVIAMDDARNWSPIVKWSPLPASVVVTNVSGFPLPALPTADGTGALTLTLEGKPVDVARDGIAYLFDTDGRLVVTNTAPARMRVVPALAAAASGKRPDYYEILFNANTGTYQINRP